MADTSRGTRVGTTMYEDVGAFHARFGLPHRWDGTPPRLLDEETYRFRLDFIVEETREFVEAHQRGSLEDVADALCDLIYVVLGTAHMMGLPLDECWAEVQRANMTKVRAAGADDPRSTRKNYLDVVKPPGFRPPNHGPIIAAAFARSADPAVRPGDVAGETGALWGMLGDQLVRVDCGRLFVTREQAVAASAYGWHVVVDDDRQIEPVVQDLVMVERYQGGR